MKTILVVGFGGMGCRHVQSLLPYLDTFKIIIAEPFFANITNNSKRISAKDTDFKYYNNIDEITEPIDLAIVATSAAPRYEIVRTLIQKGVKNFLLEKIVFQSLEQFDSILNLVKQNGIKVYCNFVNRYFEGYNNLKSRLVNQRGIKMIVSGGAFGLGCNAIHYIDLFAYLTDTDKNIVINKSLLKLSSIGNKRGGEYREFFGTLAVKNNKADELLIVSDKDYTGGGVTVTFSFGDNTYLFNQQTQKLLIRTPSQLIENDFTIIPTSRLTHKIVPEIFSGTCRLTDLENTRFAHAELFREFNTVLFGNTNDQMLCPIT